ncbi:MAG: hypothetical protein BZ133_04875 [Methanosphaera sp. SHI613]|jgi:tRNA acetyltransferase TAN1|nr:MAG: hypothetical protein BZ133_04875 [Methanosphaera sp. SHI613]
MKRNNKELLIKFNDKSDINEVDNMIYTVQDKINQVDTNYYLKESESPFIYFLEYSNPQELIKKINMTEELSTKLEIIPVTCVTSNANYVISTILKKIRHKITYNDTFNLTCHGDYLYEENKLKIESELIEQIKNITKIEENETCPNWDINLYIIGEITGINIKRKYYNQI